ncbi:MAG TPA: hypothetical protein VF941_21745 [Clostridia bacterium]
MYSGSIIKSESLDPEYRVKFSYKDEKINIPNGIAIFRREYPNPKVTFDDYTDYVIERQNTDIDTIRDIKLHVGKTVCDHLFSNSSSYQKRI